MADYPRPPANVQPYADVLGLPDTIEFLLTFGGSEIYLTTDPKGKSRLEQEIGAERVIALAQSIPHMKTRVPLAKPWIARCMKSQGLSAAEIARRLHTTDFTVRSWLSADAKAGDGSAGKDPRQLSFF